jgi:hypothetical protein
VQKSALPAAFRRKSIATISLRSEVTVAIARFVMFEIETARIFCHIAKEQPGGGKRSRLMENARKAYKTAEGRIWKLKMPHAEFDQIIAQLERLRFELSNVSKGSSDARPELHRPSGLLD